MKPILHKHLWDILDQKIFIPAIFRHDNTAKLIIDNIQIQKNYLFSKEKVSYLCPDIDNLMQKIVMFYYTQERNKVLKQYLKFILEELNEKNSSGFLAEQEADVLDLLETKISASMSRKQKNTLLHVFDIWLVFPHLTYDEKRI